MKYYLILTIIILGITIEGCSAIRRRKLCHFNELVKCYSGMQLWCGSVETTGFVVNETDMKMFCDFHKYMVPQCVRNFFQKCGNSLYQSIIEEVLQETFIKGWTTFCDGSDGREYLKHGKCLGTGYMLLPHREGYRNCTYDLQAAMEYGGTLTIEHTLFQNWGCTYNRWYNCYYNHIKPICGTEAADAIELVERAWYATLLNLWFNKPQFNPNSEACQKVFPPPGTAPKGIKSNFYLSHLYSLYSPNVAHGFD